MFSEQPQTNCSKIQIKIWNMHIFIEKMHLSSFYISLSELGRWSILLSSIYNTGTEMIYTYTHTYIYVYIYIYCLWYIIHKPCVLPWRYKFLFTISVQLYKVKQNTWSFWSSFFLIFFPSNPQRAPLVSSLISLVRCGYFPVSVCNGG